MTRSSAPMVIVIGGPNGAGKSTSAERILRGPLAVDEFVKAGLRNLFAYYLPLVDTWHVYDNRDLERPRLVAARSSGAGLVIDDPTKWEALEEIAR